MLGEKYNYYSFLYTKMKKKKGKEKKE